MSDKKKNLLAKIKEMLSAAEATEQKFAEYKLQDGTTISCDSIAVGEEVTQNGQPAAAGDYILEDGTIIKVDDAGLIVEIKEPEASTEDLTTQEGIKKAYDKFANGQMNAEQMSVILKALMEYTFGWQIREQQEKATRDAAIKAYQDAIAPMQTQLKKQGEILKQVFALMNEIVELPADDSPAATGKKKFSFANVESRKKSFERFRAAAKELNKQWSNN